MRRYTILGYIPDGRHLYLVGDDAGRLLLATNEALTNTPDLFANDAIKTDSVTWRVVDYVDDPYNPYMAQIKTRTIELETFGTLDDGYRLTCKFDAPSGKWYVLRGSVQPYHPFAQGADDHPPSPA